MDPLTHAVLGAAWAQPAARRPKLMTASLLGAGAGVAADADILIHSSTDPLLGIEFHRHFTHALAFIPIGALVCALAFYPLVRSRVTAAQCYLFCLLGYATHGLLDACTTYGTRLLWPFSDARIAWNNVSVVDPLFTVPLIVLVVLGVRRLEPRFAAAGVCWAIFYLGLGVVQNQRAIAADAELAASRGHDPVRIDAMPAFASLLVWRGVYEHDGRYYVDAIRTGWKTSVFEGQSIEKLDAERDVPWLDPESRQGHDLERFRRFADDYVAWDRSRPGYVVDLRYSFVPNRVDGLWALVLDSHAAGDAHARYVTMRARTLDEGRSLLDMIFP